MRTTSQLPVAGTLQSILITVAAFVLLTSTATAQQASITLLGGDMAICNHNNTDWTLDKASLVGAALAQSSGTAVWQVTATKGATSPNSLVFDGFMGVQNTGTANATIGNIVVNLQRFVSSKKKWVTYSSDVANATYGDAATTALVVSGASSEAKSSFSENSASGPLEFTDVDNNTTFSLAPQKLIAPGQTVNLVFSATFNNSILNIPAGELVRLEVIVSFGNAGARGGSGTVARNIDINGNGVLDPDEAYVRSVPIRITKAIPALEECNKQVTLTDPNLTLSGTVTAANITSQIGAGLVLTDTASFLVSADVAGGTDGGRVANTAFLDGQDDFVSVIIGYTAVTNADSTITKLPILRYFPCCVGVHLSKESSVDVPAESGTTPGGFKNGDFGTFTQGGWGAVPHGSNPGAVLTASFTVVYPTGVEVGIPGAAGFSMKFTSAGAITAYLPAGGPPAVLTADLMNPTSTSAGVFGGQVLALRLNVDFSTAGITQGPGGAVGSLTLVNTGTSLDGLTVAQVLAVAQSVLGGGALPAGLTVSGLNDIVTNLNQAFDNFVPTSWAQAHLAK
ncbi:MAG: hypothetical protein HY300_05025 [Verrucomicrobia bacterium]|nr:hypothetical protein [Verrucomicrobiota bacterium]